MRIKENKSKERVGEILGLTVDHGINFESESGEKHLKLNCRMNE
jgi:hypothetical protein